MSIRPGWLQKLSLLAIVPVASNCIVYQSPKCLFDKGTEPAVASLYFQPSDSTQVHVAYSGDGFASTLTDTDGLFCRRLSPAAHGPILEALASSTLTIDQNASFSDARWQNSHGRLFIYAQLANGTADHDVVWWGSEITAPAGHLERLDEVFCALERELSMLRRHVRKHAPEFLAARGRDLPCGASSDSRT